MQGMGTKLFTALDISPLQMPLPSPKKIAQGISHLEEGESMGHLSFKLMTLTISHVSHHLHKVQ